MISERVGLSQADIARSLGVSLAKVGNWFQAKNFPKRDAEPLARLLKVPVEFLLYGAVPVGTPETAVAPARVMALHEDPPAYGQTAEQLREKISARVEETLALAGNDISRLGYLNEIAQQYFLAPAHWLPRSVFADLPPGHSVRTAVESGRRKGFIAAGKLHRQAAAGTASPEHSRGDKAG